MHSSRIVLCVSQRGCLLSHWAGAKLQFWTAYLHEENAEESLRQYLLKHCKVPIDLMVDGVAEDYQLEMLPHITGRSKQAMLTRKLKQFGRGCIYQTAYFLYSNKTTRKEDAYVFFALTNIDFCQRYIAMLKNEPLLLAGVYALSMVSQKLIRQRKLDALLLCERLSSGFRQTLILLGGVRFSRLTPLPLSANHDALCMAEIEKMRAYLLSQRMITDSVALPVVVMDNGDADKQLITHIEQQPWLIVQPLVLDAGNDVSEIALKQYPELRHMQALAIIGKRPANLAPRADIKNHVMQQLGNRLMMTSALIVMFGLCVACYLLFQGYQKQLQLSPLAEQTEQLLAQKASIHYPKSPAPVNDLKTIVDIAKSINQDSPVRLMQVVSAALDSVPEVSINRMRWVQTKQTEVQDESDLDNVYTNLQAVPVNQLGFVSAEMTENYDASKTVDRFVSALRNNAQVRQVQLLLPSTHIQNTEHWVGSTGDVLDTAPVPRDFSIVIAMQPETPRKD